MTTSTATSASAAALQAGAGRMAALKFAELTLIVAQQDVRTLESAIDVDAVDPPAGAVGWIPFADGRWPVYCFSQTLERLATRPPERRICAVLRAGTQLFGVLCAEVELIKVADLPVHTIPEAMVLPGSPIQGLVMYADAIACVSSSARLLAHAQAAHRPNDAGGSK